MRCQYAQNTSIKMMQRTLVCIARAHSNVANIARLHHIVQRLHLSARKFHDAIREISSYRLLNRRILVEAMALKYVYVVQLQPLQAMLHGVEDVLRGPVSM